MPVLSIAIFRQPVSKIQSRNFCISGINVPKVRISVSGSKPIWPLIRQATMMSRCTSKPMATVNMSCMVSLLKSCRLGIARVGIRTLLLVLFTSVMRHTAVLLGNSSTLNKRGENPPGNNRTSPAAYSVPDCIAVRTRFIFIPSCDGLS